MQKVQIQKQKRYTVNVTNTTGKSWSITNTTDADVVVINASTEDDQSVEQFYERSLKILETANGQKLIKAGSTENINLEEAVYNIILARADNLFPVKAATVALDSDTQTYAPVTVTTADAERMKLAAKFQQILTAFSTSSLASDFATALADSDATKAAAFFNATDDYKTLTVDDVVAVQTYYAVYPFVWAYYGGEKNYGLHSTDGVTNKYAGYIALINESTVLLNGDKSIPGFTATYVNGATSTPLYYSAGQFVDDAASASPGICLQGLFVLKSSLTKSDDDQAIVAVLIGVINGESVLGYDEEQTVQNDGQLRDVLSSLDILLHPDDTEGWLELAGIVLATLLGFGVLCKGLYTAIKWASTTTPLTPEEIRDRIREVTQRNLDRIKDLGIKDSAKLKVPEDVAASLDDVKRRGNDLLLKENKTKMQDIVNQQSDMLQRLAEYSSTPALQLAGDTVESVYETLLNTSSWDLGDSMVRLMSDLKSSASILNSEVSQVKSRFSTEERNAIEASKKTMDTMTIQVESNERLRADLAEDRTPEERMFEEFFETF